LSTKSLTKMINNIIIRISKYI